MSGNSEPCPEPEVVAERLAVILARHHGADTETAMRIAGEAISAVAANSGRISPEDLLRIVKEARRRL